MQVKNCDDDGFFWATNVVGGVRKAVQQCSSDAPAHLWELIWELSDLLDGAAELLYESVSELCVLPAVPRSGFRSVGLGTMPHTDLDHSLILLRRLALTSSQGRLASGSAS